MKHNVNSGKIFWTTLILGLPLLAGIGWLSPEVTALVETVNKPVQLVLLEEESTLKKDTLYLKATCPYANDSLCLSKSATKPDSTYVQ